MAQRNSHVPRFGNWENEDNVPYTAYFDKARKGKSGGKIVNPNDPQENPDLYNDDKQQVVAPSRVRAEAEIPTGEGAVKPKHSRHSSREDGVPKRVTDSPGTDSPGRHDHAGRKATTDSPHHRNARDAPRRTSRHSAGSDNSIEGSPLHHQARTAGRGSGHASPAWERKSSEGGHGLAPSTPGRSRFARGDQTPDGSAAVPKFGEWDENNPASADGYTHIFNKMREERQSGSAEVPSMPTNAYNTRKQEDTSTGCLCFSWGKK